MPIDKASCNINNDASIKCRIVPDLESASSLKDEKLSELISSTNIDPGLALDLLESFNWNTEAAIKQYRVMSEDVVPNYSRELLADEEYQIPHPFDQYDDNFKTPPSSIENDSLSEVFEEGIDPESTHTSHTHPKNHSSLYNQAKVVASNNPSVPYFVETDSLSFLLPDFTQFSAKVRQRVEKDLIETNTLTALEEYEVLNWWEKLGFCKKLWPLSTKGDGNCLLHAASLGAWGFHDRKLTLRRAVHATLMNDLSGNGSIARRWRYQQMLENQELSLILSEDEWRSEWQTLVKESSFEPKDSHIVSAPTEQRKKFSEFAQLPSRECISRSKKDYDTLSFRCSLASTCDSTLNISHTYESLEQLHVYTLANVLKRPIIVVADSVLRGINGESIAPINFGGVYLPLEWFPEECHKNPLILAYDSSHFSPLLPMEVINKRFKWNNKLAIPLVNISGHVLPVHFSHDPGSDVDWNLVQQLINLETCHERNQDNLKLLNAYLFLINLKQKPDIDFTFPFTQAKHFKINKFCKIGKNFSQGLINHMKTNQGNTQYNTKSNAFNNIKSIINSSPCNFLPGGNGSHVLAGEIRIQSRLKFQEDMIKNYLERVMLDCDKSVSPLPKNNTTNSLKKTLFMSEYRKKSKSTGSLVALDNNKESFEKPLFFNRHPFEKSPSTRRRGDDKPSFQTKYNSYIYSNTNSLTKDKGCQYCSHDSLVSSLEYEDTAIKPIGIEEKHSSFSSLYPLITSHNNTAVRTSHANNEFTPNCVKYLSNNSYNGDNIHNSYNKSTFSNKVKRVLDIKPESKSEVDWSNSFSYVQHFNDYTEQHKNFITNTKSPLQFFTMLKKHCKHLVFHIFSFPDSSYNI